MGEGESRNVTPTGGARVTFCLPSPRSPPGERPATTPQPGQTRERPGKRQGRAGGKRRDGTGREERGQEEKRKDRKRRDGKREKTGREEKKRDGTVGTRRDGKRESRERGSDTPKTICR